MLGDRSCASARTRLAAVVLSTIVFAACTAPPAPSRPPLRSIPPPIAEPPDRPVRYLRTLGGGWRIKLNDDHRSLTKCQYGLRVGHARANRTTLYLRAEFENPLDRHAPLYADAKLEPWMHEVALRSPEVRGLRKGSRYMIRVHIYDHPERRRRIGVHEQVLPARLSVSREGRVTF